MENKNKSLRMRLLNVAIRLQAMNLKKTGKNKYSGFEYYELQDFLPQVMALLDELNIFPEFNLEQDKATLTYVDGYDESKSVTFTVPVERVELKGCSEMQGIGAMSTYARRYLFVNSLQISEKDTLDENAGNITKNNNGNDNDDFGTPVNTNFEIKTLEDLQRCYAKFKDRIKRKDPQVDKLVIKMKEAAKALGAVFDRERDNFFLAVA
jgi:hypothetical protein